MEYISTLRRLSDDFYNAYPRETFPEIMQKGLRPYNILLIDANNDYFICVPFRSEIKHRNAFLFKNSARSRNSSSGLDYSKICIVQKMNYISVSPGIVDRDEYVEMYQNLDEIVEQACAYVSNYVAHQNGSAPLSATQYRKRYKYSTLPYFHKELGL